jgi:hypothetical protein
MQILIEQYSWVIKVLESCENESHISCTEKLFNFFLRNCEDKISESKKNTLIDNFQKLKKVKNLRIRKNSF